MLSNTPHTISIETPQPAANPADVKVEEIPLPPQELWEELDNRAAGQSTEPAPAIAPSAKTREIAALDFGGREREVYSLAFPFSHPDLGHVSQIEVRRLTVGEVGSLLDNLPQNEPDNFWIYARMTGVPAPVLRGLVDIDGEEVTNRCFDFLPRVFRPGRAASSSTSEPGGT